MMFLIRREFFFIFFLNYLSLLNGKLFLFCFQIIKKIYIIYFSSIFFLSFVLVCSMNNCNDKSLFKKKSIVLLFYYYLLCTLLICFYLFFLLWIISHHQFLRITYIFIVFLGKLSQTAYILRLSIVI